MIAYRRIGERSAHTWFVLHELLGYGNVRNYDGSWTEYGSLVGCPSSAESATGSVDEPNRLAPTAFVRNSLERSSHAGALGEIRTHAPGSGGRRSIP